MISISGKQWEEKKVSKNLVEKLKQDYKFSEIISKLIISRNFDNAEISSIENKPHLINIFKNNSDFNQSINLLCESINKKENICILGDYDVDGSVATSLLVNFFQHIKQPFFYYIPDRVKDGYGASKVLFEKLIKKKPKLIIMVDCGSTSIEAVDFLNKNKIKSIIIDHHEINKPYPKANIIINPKKDNGYIEYNYLCASALVYFFIDLLIKKIEPSFDIKKYLIHVLLATVCDVMPLRKLNRFISMSALENFDINENEVFYELYKLSNKNNKINIGDLGFLIGPILNSGGRLGKSSYAIELLTSNKYDVIKKRAAELFFLNQKRREIETTIINEVDFKKIEKDVDRWIKEKKHLYDNVRPKSKYFQEVIRVSVNQIIWGGNYYTDDLYENRGWICWDKKVSNPNYSDFELAWTSFDKTTRFFRYCNARWYGL